MKLNSIKLIKLNIESLTKKENYSKQEYENIPPKECFPLPK